MLKNLQKLRSIYCTKLTVYQTALVFLSPIRDVSLSITYGTRFTQQIKYVVSQTTFCQRTRIFFLSFSLKMRLQPFSIYLFRTSHLRLQIYQPYVTDTSLQRIIQARRQADITSACVTRIMRTNTEIEEVPKKTCFLFLCFYQRRAAEAICSRYVPRSRPFQHRHFSLHINIE